MDRLTRHISLVGVLAIGAALGCTQRGGGPGEAAGAGAGMPHYGELMSEVGHRLEFLGRAAVAHRWELAAFELDELREVFDDLPGAQLPEKMGDIKVTNLRELEDAFRTTDLAALEKALAAKDEAALAAAFAKAASDCNACHQATAHAFIEIPSKPGDAVPRLDPLP